MTQIVSLSRCLKVPRSLLESEDILDVDLGLDLRFFVDPLLVRSSKIPEFKDSRKKTISYFSRLIKLATNGYKSDELREAAIKMLAVKEPPGCSLGYGGKSDKGTAVSRTVATEVIRKILILLKVGIDDPSLIEYLSMFVTGYGSDSISDLTIHILYDEFCTFTQRKAKEFKVQTSIFPVGNKKYNLPAHPFKKEQPIIFVPTSFISELPVANDWEGVRSISIHNQDLRNNADIDMLPSVMEHLHEVVKMSPKEKEAFSNGLTLSLEAYKNHPVKPYNLLQDPTGYYNLQPLIEKVSADISVEQKPKNKNSLVVFVRDILKHFAKLVEHNAWNRQLYGKNGKKESPHDEGVAQRLLFGVADIYCTLANVFLARESNSGRGPVDFSLGNSYREKIILELKKSNNKQLKKGFIKQVEAYERSESAFYSFYPVVVVSARTKNDQLSEIEVIYKAKIKNKEKVPELFIIDGIKKPSPSKLK